MHTCLIPTKIPKIGKTDSSSSDLDDSISNVRKTENIFSNFISNRGKHMAMKESLKVVSRNRCRFMNKRFRGLLFWLMTGFLFSPALYYFPKLFQFFLLVSAQISWPFLGYFLNYKLVKFIGFVVFNVFTAFILIHTCIIYRGFFLLFVFIVLILGSFLIFLLSVLFVVVVKTLIVFLKMAALEKIKEFYDKMDSQDYIYTGLE